MVVGTLEGVILTMQASFKLKTTFCKYWLKLNCWLISIEIKISMTCVYNVKLK